MRYAIRKLKYYSSYQVGIKQISLNNHYNILQTESINHSIRTLKDQRIISNLLLENLEDLSFGRQDLFDNSYSMNIETVSFLDS